MHFITLFCILRYVLFSIFVKISENKPISELEPFSSDFKNVFCLHNNLIKHNQSIAICIGKQETILLASSTIAQEFV